MTTPLQGHLGLATGLISRSYPLLALGFAEKLTDGTLVFLGP